MKRNIIYYFTLFFLISCSEKEIGTAQLKHELTSFISAGKPNRSVGQPGHQNTIRYLSKRFDSLSKQQHIKFFKHKFKPDIQFAVNSYLNDFEVGIEQKYEPNDPIYLKWKRFTDNSIQYVKSYKDIYGTNLILEIKGSVTPDHIIYVGAHFDSITHEEKTFKFTPKKSTVGADDNASGIAATLALAEYFSKNRPPNTIRFLALDFEEVFFLGSYALARMISKKSLTWTNKNETVEGYYNLEMIGWSKKNPTVKIYTRKNAPGLTSDNKLVKKFRQAHLSRNSPLKVIAINNGFNRSDNWSFWQWDIPSICITQDWENDFNEDNYHTDHDDQKSLNIKYMTEITNILKETLSK